MTARPVSALLVAGLSAALAIAASAAFAQTAPLDPRVALKVGAIGAVSDAGIFVAQDRGYFNDEGLDVELVSFRAAPQILPAIATGEVQVSGSAVTPALFKIAPTGFDLNGRMELKSLEADQDWYLKLGLQQGRADLGKIIDYQYLDYAISRLGKR